MSNEEATYQYINEEYGNGMFFYTDCCGNRMYSVNKDPMFYHGCLFKENDSGYNCENWIP